MLWLILGIFALLLLCMYLENDTRQTTRHIHKLADMSRKNDMMYHSNTRLWFQ